MAESDTIGNKIIRVETLSSTNDYVSKAYENESMVNGNVILTSFQEHGRGQQHNVWESASGENLLLSFVLDDLPSLPGIVNKTFCLAISSTVQRYVNTEVYIKWPNDIIHNRTKIAGLLIENTYRGSSFVSCVIGIGLNVNQEYFQEYKIPASSLCTITGRKYSLDECFDNLLTDLNYWYDQYKKGKYDFIHGEYIKRLWGSNEMTRFRASGQEFFARIIGVDDYGSLILMDDKDQIRRYLNKEVEFIF